MRWIGVTSVVLMAACGTEAPQGVFQGRSEAHERARQLAIASAAQPSMVVVAARGLPAGAVLTAADIKVLDLAPERRPRLSTGSADGLAGVTLKAAVAAGEPILITNIVVGRRRSVPGERLMLPQPQR